MQHSSLKNLTRILLGVIIGGASLVGVVYAINTLYEGYLVNASTTKRLNLRAHSGYSDCQDVTASSNTIFVPTRTAVEWNAFKANRPSAIAVNPCPTTTANNANVNWSSTSWDPISAQCPGGYHPIGYTAIPYYLTTGNCMGNNITMNAYLYSAVVAGNGYEVDFFIPNHPSQNEHPINPGIIWDRSSNNFGWISVDQYCGGGTLVITCEAD